VLKQIQKAGGGEAGSLAIFEQTKTNEKTEKENKMNEKRDRGLLLFACTNSGRIFREGEHR